MSNSPTTYIDFPATVQVVWLWCSSISRALVRYLVVKEFVYHLNKIKLFNLGNGLVEDLKKKKKEDGERVF